MEHANTTIPKPNARIQAFAAAIRFVDARHQKRLYILLKLMEMRAICKHFDEANPDAQKADFARKQDIIAAVLPHVGEARRGQLEQLAKMAEMREFINNFKELNLWT